MFRSTKLFMLTLTLCGTLTAGQSEWIITQSKEYTLDGFGHQTIPSLAWQHGPAHFFRTLSEANSYCLEQGGRVPTILEVYALYLQKEVLGGYSRDLYGSQTAEPGYPNELLSVDFRDGKIVIGSYAGQSILCVH